MREAIQYLGFVGTVLACCISTVAIGETTDLGTACSQSEEKRQSPSVTRKTRVTASACEREIYGYYRQFPQGRRYDPAYAFVEESMAIGDGRCRLVEVHRPQVVSRCRGACPVTVPGAPAIDIWACVRGRPAERIVRGVSWRDTVLDVDPIPVSHLVTECGVGRSRDALVGLYMTIVLADRQTFRSRNALKPPYWRSVGSVQDLPAGARKGVPKELEEVLQQAGVARDLANGVVAESRCVVASYVMEDVSWEVTCWDFFFAPGGDLVEADLLFNDILGYRMNDPFRSPRTGMKYWP